MLERYDNVQAIIAESVRYCSHPKQRELLKVGQRGTIIQINDDATYNIQFEDLRALVNVPARLVTKLQHDPAPVKNE